MLDLANMIYLDNAASTQIPQEVLDSLYFQLECNFGNANTKYKVGAFAEDFMEASRQTIADCIGAKPEEIYFTSGATEANNWVFTNCSNQNNKPRIICSNIEHESVIEPLKYLHDMDRIHLDMLKANNLGIITEAELDSKLQIPTNLVSIMYANNEIGSIQDIKNLAAQSHAHNALVHCDAVQALGHINFNVKDLDVDFLSASAHKFHGPKGVGFLYVKEGVPLTPMLFGGGQEKSMRSGTQNVPYIVGMAEALSYSLQKQKEFSLKFKQWQDYLFEYLCSNISSCLITGDRYKRLDHLASFIIDGVDTETLLMLLDQEGVCVSAGSACSSGNLEISHVLKAIGFDDNAARGALRISYSYLNTFDEIKKAAHLIVNAVEKCRMFTDGF